MSSTTRPGLRWAVPAGVAALVVGGAVAGPALSASAEVELPERSAAQLLTDLQTAEVDAFSGTVTHHADLGLPALPDGMGGEHSTDLTSLLDGDHELRVWAAGEKGRVALKGRLGEFGVVSDGTDLWTWSSDDNTATHLTLPAHDTGDADDDAAWARELPQTTPEQVTDAVLAALEPTTRVTSGPNALVAGRAAYELVLEPREEGSLIGSVRISVDAAERVPTRVQVVPAGSTAPALEVAFTELSFATPPDDVFTFDPGPGVTVEEHPLPDRSGSVRHHGLTDDVGAAGGAAAGAAEHDRVAVVGRGWSAVLVSRLPDGVDLADLTGMSTGRSRGRSTGRSTGTDALGGDVGAFLEALPRVQGDWGTGRLLESRLFSALLTDDGRLLAGAVDGDTLREAAGNPAAALD
jgi:outer membrane lipoprotein-sorting protein